MSNKKYNFIDKAKAVHGNAYDYSKAEYKGSHTKVCIICPKHGEFWQTPSDHLRGRGCPKCARNRQANAISYSTEDFIKKAKDVKAHQGKEYDYSNTVYRGSSAPITITCPKHGDFTQLPYIHLQGHGCPECAKEKRKKKQTSYTEEFIQKAKKVEAHKGKGYIYTETVYTDAHTKLCIICPKHGKFWQIPNNHLSGSGCPECAKEEKRKKQSLTDYQFLQKAKKIHKGKNYDYSKSVYINNRTPVIIICPKHGEFLQTPSDHLQGHGCPKCRSSQLEIKTETFLKENNINYESQKKFDWLVSNKNHKMSLDFFLPSYNLAIECQGIQHYKINGFFTEEIVHQIKQRDKLKNKLCNEHNIEICYIKYDADIKRIIARITEKLKNKA